MEREFVTDQGDIIVMPVVEENKTVEDAPELSDEDYTTQDESQIDWSTL